ncbi:MAG: retropepsin-like aspartic protease [Rhizobacter sp.]
MRRLAAGLVLAGWAGLVAAQQVSMSGSLGASKALLIIDGQPRTVAVGSTVGGVRLISTGPEQSVVDVGGRRLTLRIGAAHVGDGADTPGDGSRIVLSAGSGGHFMAIGSINGASTQFMVDTGATSVALSQAEADRLGVKYRQGRQGKAHTAGGEVAIYGVKLAAVRVGDVTVRDVDAVVVPAPMPYVLLGNSFLSRFQMTRSNDIMTLDRRF